MKVDCVHGVFVADKCCNNMVSVVKSNSLIICILSKSLEQSHDVKTFLLILAAIWFSS